MISITSRSEQILVSFSINMTEWKASVNGYVLNPAPEMEEWRIGVILDSINTLNYMCFINEFDKVVTKKFKTTHIRSSIYCNTLLKLVFYFLINDTHIKNLKHNS